MVPHRTNALELRFLAAGASHWDNEVRESSDANCGERLRRGGKKCQVRNVLSEFYRSPDELAVGEGLDLESLKAVDDLRFERYRSVSRRGRDIVLQSEVARSVYYFLRPAMPGSFRRGIQRIFLRDWDKLAFPRWPVDTSVEDKMEQLLLESMKVRRLQEVPFIWFWPDGASNAVVMTHDVETAAGLNFVHSLMDVDEAFGIPSSFQLVPEERYAVSRELRDVIRKRGFEANVHGLDHEGNLFRDRDAFVKLAARINRHVQDFEAQGFRSTCMYRNVEWMDQLNVAYDMSVPNVAHLEPQRGGCCTVFPYFTGRVLELPLTTVQDYSLFHVLGDYSLDLWKAQIERIMAKHGLISFIVHPDYILEEPAMAVYKALLAYLTSLRDEHGVWVAGPGQVNRWWRERNAMNLSLRGGRWQVEGPGQERARIALASFRDGRLVYSLQPGGSGAACGAGEVEAGTCTS
jgi:hypothetical protein